MARGDREGFEALISSKPGPENSLASAIYVVKSAVLSAALYAGVGGLGAHAVLSSMRRVPRELRLLAPALGASAGALLGSQQGTLHALVELQPTTSLKALREDLEGALADENAREQQGGSRPVTYVFRETRSALKPRDAPLREEELDLIVHPNSTALASSGADDDRLAGIPDTPIGRGIDATLGRRARER